MTNNPAAAKTTAIRAAELSERDLDAMPYATLRWAVESIVPLVEIPIDLNGTEFLWHKVVDPDLLLSEAVTLSDLPATDVDPFWAVSWRAAEGLDTYLDRFELDGTRVLELGAGAGYAGLSAAARGAQVTLTDSVDLALLVARLNSWPVKSRTQLRRLRWGDDVLGEAAFPIIISSDLVYDPTHFTQLERCARQHLAAGGHWILSEPNRHTGDRFGQWIEENGWQCATHQLDLSDSRIAIRIFDCQIKGNAC